MINIFALGFAPEMVSAKCATHNASKCCCSMEKSSCYSEKITDCSKDISKISKCTCMKEKEDTEKDLYQSSKIDIVRALECALVSIENFSQKPQRALYSKELSGFLTEPPIFITNSALLI